MPERTRPADFRAQLMRAAGDAIGSERLARELQISPRNGYKLMAGKSPVRTDVLADTRRVLVEHRQRVAMLIQLLRDEEAKGSGR